MPLERNLQQALDETWQTKQPALDVSTRLQQWIAEHHHFPTEPLQFIRRGSGLVFRLGTERFVKLYSADRLYSLTRERYGLHHCRHKLPVQVPVIEAEGQIGPWPYLVLSRLTGHYLVDVWEQLSLDNKCQIAYQLGQLMRTFHQLPLEPLPELNIQPREIASRSRRLKQAYIVRLSQGLQHHHLPAQWLEVCLNGMQEGVALLDSDQTLVLAHRNMGATHLLLNGDGKHWQLTGLFDFNAIACGPALTEFVIPVIGLYQEPPVVRQLFSGYGFQSTDLDLSFAKRLAAMMLLNTRFDSRWLIPLMQRIPSVSWDALVNQLCYFLNTCSNK